MQHAFKCPYCSNRILTDCSQIGSKVRCENCRESLSVPATSVMPGLILQSYWVQKKLGTGDLGDVFLAKDMANDNRKVAVKVLSPALTADPALLQAFLDQTRLALEIRHTNVARVLDVGQSEGNCFIVSEYVAGEDLSARLKRERIVAEGDALRLVLKVARTLETVLLEHGLLHGDLKLTNIQVGTDGTVRILDLGVYKGMLARLETTAVGERSSTLDYLSPELAAGDGHWDERSDIYSLGGLLFHLVTGNCPFNGSTSTEVISKHLYDPLPEVQKLNPRVSRDCADLINRMMAKQPEERYANWSAVIADLERILKEDLGTNTVTLDKPERLPEQVVAQAAREAAETGENPAAGPPVTPTGSHSRTPTTGTTRKKRKSVKTISQPIPKPDEPVPAALPADGGNKLMPVLVGAIAVAVLIFAGLLLVVLGKMGEEGDAARPQPPIDETANAPADEFARRYEEIEAHLAANPQDVERAIASLSQLRSDAVGTEYQRRAHERIQELRARPSPEAAAPTEAAPTEAAPTEATPVPAPGNVPPPSDDSPVAQLYRQTAAYAKAHPDDLSEVTIRYRKLCVEAAGTHYYEPAKETLDRLLARQAEATNP